MQMLDWDPDQRPSAQTILQSGIFSTFNKNQIDFNIIRGVKNNRKNLNDLLEEHQNGTNFDWL